MKHKLLWILLTFAAATHAGTSKPSTLPVLEPSQQQSRAANLAAHILERFPYKKMPLDDAMSSLVLDRYLKALDSDKLFFTQADIDQFANARTVLDDAINREDLHIPFLIFNLYEHRVTERLAYARKLLQQGFDFNQQESFQYERAKASWAKSEDEMRELWRKRVKNDWLRLKLNGKQDKAIRATLDKRYGMALSRFYKTKSEDVFQIFMDAYATSVDPHTDYLGPSASADFDIAMKLSLVGIGAVLFEKDDYVTIRELVPGGPAALSGKLHVGDRIVGVGQEKSSAMVDVVGWRVNDAVALIRGTKDSTVRLNVLPASAGPDSKHKLVTLVRNKISLEQQAAKKSIIQIADGAATRQIGVISLPAFYQDFDARSKGDKEFRSASRDVARLLEELKKDKVDAVLIDLRNNGGGSLDEGVALTGLFTGEGPVVQERNSQGAVKVDSSTTKRVWDGPLGVLINRGSASASEIFAAAIQDYGRGVIIGETSYGKGTVQTMVDLDQIQHQNKPTFGTLKMTVTQFFRINGGTTQLRGVTPDISLPSLSDVERFGESSFENALPWAKINAADYKPAGNVAEVLPLLQKRHAARVEHDQDFQYLLQDVADVNAQRKKNTISLNESERRRERDLQEAKLKLRAANGQAEEDTHSQAATKKETAGVKKIATENAVSSLGNNDADNELAEEAPPKNGKDIWLKEAAHILSDEAGLVKKNAEALAHAPHGAIVTSDGKRE